MEYRAVGNRCAVDIDALQLPLTREEILNILAGKGFGIIEVDLVMLARRCIGRSRYRRGARLWEAPGIVDCSSFMKWLYGKAGMWLPRLSIQQREFGEAVEFCELVADDLVFVSGHIDYHRDNPADDVGHVGIATGDKTVIQATYRAGVIESELDAFIGKAKFRGVRRYLPKDRGVLTFETPAGREIESADDIKWIVLRSLPKIRGRNI